ncbi:MAG: hypothetical protein ACRDLB_00295 [Actinomycetota bacterium]
MATKSAVLTRVPRQSEFSDRIKARVASMRGAGRRWTRRGQLGSLSSTELGRHTGARI